MKELFETPSGIKLFQDEDHSLVSTNPAEVLCTFLGMKQSNNGLKQLVAEKFLNICHEHGGIFMDAEGPKEIEATHGCLFFYRGADGLGVMRCPSSEADFQAFRGLTLPIKLVL